MLQKFDERNRDLLVNINGRLVHRNEAGVSPFDSAVQGGDAVWEGLRLYDGRIFKLREHLDLQARADFFNVLNHANFTGAISPAKAARSIRRCMKPRSPG